MGFLKWSYAINKSGFFNILRNIRDGHLELSCTKNMKSFKWTTFYSKMELPSSLVNLWCSDKAVSKDDQNK